MGFRDELYELATRAKDKIHALRLLSQPETHARVGEDFEVAGRVDVELLKALLPLDDYDFYLCGPGRLPRRCMTACAPCALVMIVFTPRLSDLRP